MDDVELIAMATRLAGALKAKADADAAMTLARNAMTLAQNTLDNATKELLDSHTSVAMAVEAIAADHLAVPPEPITGG